jgi:membrane-bound lytic murein transglycosylase B
MNDIKTNIFLNASKFLVPLLWLVLSASSGFSATYSRDDLIQYMIKETNLAPDYVRKYLDHAKFDGDLIRKMDTPYEARPYTDYRPLFVNARMKKKSQAYLKKHHAIFVEAQEKYGVAPEMITAILGIETRFGENWGRDKVLDALYTLASGYERRAKFFRKELKAFLILCDEEGLDPSTIEGSYAGAFGVTQLMPSSFLEYAVDGDGDGKRDVWGTPKDIIFSVAYYFQRNHWSDAKMVAHWLPTLPDDKLIKTALKDETRVWRPLQAFEKVGIKKPSNKWYSDEKVALITRETADGERSLLVNRNFYAITRWNRSWNYALAATELALMLGNQQCDIGK